MRMMTNETALNLTPSIHVPNVRGAIGSNALSERVLPDLTSAIDLMSQILRLTKFR
jgi:hypothetical protein